MIAGLVFLAALAAFVVSTIAGGGAGLVLVPLLQLMLPIENVPAALSLGTAVSSVSRIALFRRSIRWDVVRRFVPSALPGGALGAWLLTRFEPSYVELILSCFLLANLPLLFRGASAGSESSPLPPSRIPWLGAAAGLISGFTGAVGILFNGAYHRLGMTKDQIVATRATNELLLHLLKIVLYVVFGLMTREALVAGALIASAAVLAGAITRPVLRLIDEGAFRRIGLLAMVISGVAMFAMSSQQIARLHQAWVALVRAGDEQEVQLFWNGEQRVSLEREAHGGVVVERTVRFESLSPHVRAAILAEVHRRDIRMIELVTGPGIYYYEVYYTRNGQAHTIEVKVS